MNSLVLIIWLVIGITSLALVIWLVKKGYKAAAERLDERENLGVLNEPEFSDETLVYSVNSDVLREKLQKIEKERTYKLRADVYYNDVLFFKTTSIVSNLKDLSPDIDFHPKEFTKIIYEIIFYGEMLKVPLEMPIEPICLTVKQENLSVEVRGKLIQINLREHNFILQTTT